MPWLAVTLEIDAGALEAMSDALVEAGAQSVSIENIEHPRPTLQALLAADEDADRLVRGAARAAGLSAAPRFTARPVADQDWVRSTQAQFAPIEVGARLWIGPSWHEPPGERVAVRVDPGLAFGTGTHPTTRSILAFLDSAIRGGERLLDYGCGSGILAIAAAKLGAASVDAVDIDTQAVQTALENAAANRVHVRIGLPDALPPASYDIVVSNILAQPLIVLAPLLARRTVGGGRLALAGILDAQAAEVAAAYAPWFDLRAERSEEGWALICGVRR
jgi:ribosomal protein L11 methyltransferase